MVTSRAYIRYPHIHGNLLTFVSEDDVWLVPTHGGRAWRLTADAGRATYPRFAPDGTKIAWTSWRDGAPEVYVADTDGGLATRLTYWGDQMTRVIGWTTGNEIIAVSSVGQPQQHLTWGYLIPIEDKPLSRLPFGPVMDVAMDADATALISGRLDQEPAFWKRYRGGSTGRLWVRTAADPVFKRVLAELGGQIASPMFVGDRLAFLSDHDGIGNLYSCDLDGMDLRGHTCHKRFFVRNPSTDGHQTVYHAAGDLWIIEDMCDAPHPVEVTLGSTISARAPRFVSAVDRLGDLDCDEAGQASVVEVQGTIHWLTHHNGPARALSVDPATRGRMPRVLGTTGNVVWVSDTGGGDALVVTSAERGHRQEAAPLLLAAGEMGSVVGIAPAPGGATVAIAAHDGRVLLVDIDSGRVRELASSKDGQASGLAWSPDSAWLAWSQPGPRPLRRIRIAGVAEGLATEGLLADVTDGRFIDTEPVFTRDGRYLAFLSVRSFDSVSDAHSFDLSFPLGSQPYLIPLSTTTTSPFEPSQESGYGSGFPAALPVDVEGMADRVIGLPVRGTRYLSLYAVKDGLAWLRCPAPGSFEGSEGEPSSGRPSLERFDLSTPQCVELASGVDWFTVSGDGNRIVVRDRGEVRVLPSHQRSSTRATPVDLSRARFQADPAALWRHAYAEAGRIMQRDFWSPDMSGVDWETTLDTYRPLLERICSDSDFVDLLWEVFGELSTSHAFVASSRASGIHPRPVALGQLGADISWNPAGGWFVDRILKGDSSDPRTRAPLAVPGLRIRAGDELHSVDGRLVDPVRGPRPLLAGVADKPVEVTIRSERSPSELSTHVVVPLRDERRLRYRDWVTDLRRRVHQAGANRIGYLHIPDMSSEGWEDFHRDFRTETQCDVVIVDVRGNRGGHTSHLLVEKLARRVIGWKAGRWRQSEPYPRDAPRGPVVALIDEFSGSDGEIAAVAIRALGLGQIVGARTWGGATGLDLPGYLLVDGTRITVPKYAFSFVGYDQGVENHGVDPDIEVTFTPEDHAAGRDPQLEAAIQLALESLV